MVTIFVNPRQFDEPADLARYPRDEARDLATAARPRASTSSSRRRSTRSTRPASTRPSTSGADRRPLEGAARPGHFDGVATVVAILFGLVGRRAGLLRPEGRPAAGGHPADGARPRASRPRSSPARPSASPTAWRSRSRNVRLSPAERAAAPVLHRALTAARRCGPAASVTRRPCGSRCVAVLAAEPLADRRLRERRGPDDARGARPRRRAGAALPRRPVRLHPPDRQRPPRRGRRDRSLSEPREGARPGLRRRGGPAPRTARGSGRRRDARRPAP